MRIAINNRNLRVITDNLDSPQLKWGFTSERKMKVFIALKVIFGILLLPLTLLGKLFQLLFSLAFILPVRSIENHFNSNHNIQKFLHHLQNTLGVDQATIHQVVVKSLLGFKNTSYAVLLKDASYARNENKKIIIIFGGITNTLESVNNFYKDFYRPGEDFYYVSHPLRAINYDAAAVVRCGVAHLKNLLDLGYKPENIEIGGFSLGGGISAETLARFSGYKLQDGRILGKDCFFGAYHNIHSFNNFGNAASGLIFRKANSRLGQSITTGLSKINGFFLDSVNALGTACFPVKSNKVNIYTAVNDEVISKQASLGATNSLCKDYNYCNDMLGHTVSPSLV